MHSQISVEKRFVAFSQYINLPELVCAQTCCRYAALMFDQPNYEDSAKSTVSKKHHKHSNIEYLNVYVYSFDQSLNLDTDESYTLTVHCHFMDFIVHHHTQRTNHCCQYIRISACIRHPARLTASISLSLYTHFSILLADNAFTADMFVADVYATGNILMLVC